MVEDYGYFYDIESGEYIINGEKYFPIIKTTGLFSKRHLYNLPLKNNCINIIPNLPTVYEYQNEYQNKKFDKELNTNTYMVIHTIDKNAIFQFILYVLSCTILFFITIQVII
jgi:hypothetical protein